MLEEKLKLDGVKWDEFVLKDNVGNLLRGRFRARSKASAGMGLRSRQVMAMGRAGRER